MPGCPAARVRLPAQASARRAAGRPSCSRRTAARASTVPPPASVRLRGAGRTACRWTRPESTPRASVPSPLSSAGAGAVLSLTRADPLEAARAAKQTAALLREARGVLRKLDKLVASSSDEDPPLPHLVVETRDALERVVNHLTRQEHTLQQRARESVRRSR